jgi:predicted permease
MLAFWQDFRYAGRMLAQKPVLTIVIILSLAIGIGANSAIFSVVNALLLGPLPYPQPSRLAAIWIHSPGIGIFRDWPSPGQYNDLLHESHSFEEISISRLTSFTLLGHEEPQLIDGMRTSSNLFHLLGARAMLGRLLLPDDEVAGKNVAVISRRLWQRFFSSDPQVVGKGMNIQGNLFTIVGVLSPEFMLNSEVMPAEGPAEEMDVFCPIAMTAEFLNRRGDENYDLLARLKPGVTAQQAQADLDVIASRIREKDKRDKTFGFGVIGLLDQVVGDVRRTLLVLFGSVALVLLIACANVANLLLTGAAGRQREMAVRAALGAGWQRLMRQLLTESVLLSLISGVVGIAIAQGSLQVVRAINPGNIPRLETILINTGVMAFTFGISLVTGILFGLAPVWSAVKLDLNAALKSGGRSGHDGGGLSIARHRLRGLLVVSELTFSVMLVIGAGLLIRSFFRIQEVRPGFATDHIISLRVVATGQKYRQESAIIAFYRELGERLRQVPGVSELGLTSVLPLTGTVSWGGINVEGFTPQPGQELQADIRVTDANYFSTMEVPLVAGRFFSDHDSKESAAVVIIDQKFAERFWPKGGAVGKHLWFDPKKPMVIAGVVGNVKQYGLDSDAKIAVYFPNTQVADNGMYVVARTAGEAAALANPITAQVHATEPSAVVYDIRTMDDRLYRSLARRRFASVLLGSFAIFAMILAGVGVYGVMSYLVSQNTHEIGIRVALGAQSGSILAMVLKQGLSLAAVGILAGLAGAFGLTRVMVSLLFGVSALDWVTFALVALLLAIVALAATVIPATRAMSIDPTVALRED